ncbi:MAG TPA: DUF2959 family protein [Planctomycetota bacterium]|nr:DUF2959 family protein [Planctomycetota bacterium]
MTLATRAVLALCFGAALVACSGPKTEGQKKMSQLSEQMQRLDMALQSSKVEIQKTIEAHDMLVANADADLSGNFSRFHSAMEHCTERQKEIGSLLDQISATSTSYFAGWQADLDRIDNADLRERSAQRLEQTKARLEQVQSQVATTKTAFEPLMQTLHDHLIYLSNDLTIDSVASLSKDSGKLRSDVGPLYTALDQSTQPVRECARALSTSPQG